MTPLLIAVAFLRIDIETGAITARNWPDEPPVAIGSLEKPFIALAYAQSHQFEYPRLQCKPGTCWLPRGHGLIGIEEAIAQSCNTYFHLLRRQLPPDSLESTVRRFGLSNPAKATPEALLRAYIELHKRASEPGVAPILTGMRRAAAEGTAQQLHHDALAKTGTAPCTHTPKAPGDGFAIVLHPASAPRTAIIVRLHGHPGSHAAGVSGQYLGNSNTPQ